MKKKNLLFTTMLLFTTLFFAACGSKDNPSEDISAQGSSGAEITTPIVSDGDNAVQTTFSLPKVTITHHQEYQYADDETTVVFEYSADKVSLEGVGYEKAAQTVSELFTGNSEMVADMVETAREDYAYGKSNGDPYFIPYSSTSTCEIARLDQNIFSIKRYTYDYSGGTLGYSSTEGTTIDLKTGEQIELIDLAIDSYALIEDCTNSVLKQLESRAGELLADYKTYVTDNLPNCSWYMDASGIVFIFAPYEIGANASDSIQVCVPYSQVADHMKPEYCGIQGDCIAMVQAGAQVSFTTTDDKAKKIIFKTSRISEYGDFRTVLHVDKEKIELGDNVCLETAYLMHNTDGKTFLLYTVDWASEDYETYVYDLTGETAVQTGNLWARLNRSSFGADTLSLNFRLDVLGTYFSDMEYTLTEDGMLKPLEDIYHIETYYGRSGLTTIKELPVLMNNNATTLPVGTRLYIVATDNDGTAWFEVAGEDGAIQKGLIRYIRDAESYRIYIDGVVEDEYFEMLPYVG